MGGDHDGGVHIRVPGAAAPEGPSQGRPGGAGAVEEAALLGRLRRGESSAFEVLVRTHAPRMLAVARRLLGDEDEARDAVQEAFLSAFRGLDGFCAGSRLSASAAGS
jgi:RNA polymerase sigma-70 factor (ECF subfamily)